MQLRYGEELEISEVASRLGRTTEAVGKALQRLRQALAECVRAWPRRRGMSGQRLQALIAASLDGSLDAAGRAELSRLVAEDPNAADALARACWTERGLERILSAEPTAAGETVSARIRSSRPAMTAGRAGSATEPGPRPSGTAGWLRSRLPPSFCWR